MYALGLPQLPAMLTLRGWPALLLDLYELPVGVRAGRGTVALYARPAGEFGSVHPDHVVRIPASSFTGYGARPEDICCSATLSR